ncbi:MAG: nitrous oxide reductase family maturation protein NosD, partial [Candidatus Hodarchaeota archaeon]
MMKQNRLLIVSNLMVLLTLILSLNQNNLQELEVSDPRQPLASIQGITAYVERGPIKIFNNSAFGDDGYDFNGTGTSNDPYLIDGYNITDSTSYLIHIENTTLYFRISNCYLNSKHSAVAHINLVNVTHGTIENNTNHNFSDNKGIALDESNRNIILNNTFDFGMYGIYFYQSSNNTVSGNTFNDCEYGYYTLESHNNSYVSNTFSNGERGIQLISSHNNTLVGNLINDSSHMAIYMDECSNNTLLGNTIYEINQEGI